MRLFVVFALFSVVFCAFSCKDQSNKNVDWFAVYKMPIESDNSVPGISGGIGWYYFDASQKALEKSAKTLDATDQAIAYTLNEFYAKKSDKTIFHVMYNDEPYGSSSSLSEALLPNISVSSVQFGHTKGVAFFDGTSGVWLVHSVPKFPPPDKYAYPASGHDYGQTMLCMTFKYSELESIGTQLYYNHPDIYSSNLPSNMASANPNLAKVIGGQYKQGTPYSSLLTLKTAGGLTVKSFAKSNQFNADLYDGLVAPNLKVDLEAETWRRGDLITLDCKAQYHTLDAQNIKVGSSAEFSYTKDHSKMARSLSSSSPYVCIGDINRMTSQYVRGGGTECISNSALYNAFNVIVNTNKC